MTSFTIADASTRAGLPESTLRYWERIGLVGRIPRDESSGHRRYTDNDIALLETLGNLRAVGMSIEDMRVYRDEVGRGDATATERKELFRAHADRLREDIDAMRTRLRYLEMKVEYWTALEAGDRPRAAALADELVRVIRQINPKEQQ